MRVVFDTNIFISLLIRPGQTFRGLIDIVDRQATLLYSAEALTELVAVLRRPKFLSFTSVDETADLVKWIIETGELIPVDRQVTGSRDIADNKFLSLAISGHADYLISGDKDLLVLGRIGGTQIMSAAQFISVIGQYGPQ